MALIKCSECDHEIAKQAKVCPSCGAKNKKRMTLGKVLVVLIGVSWIIAMLTDSDTSTSSKGNINVSAQTTEIAKVLQEPIIETPAWSCSKERRYMYLRGEVKNTSNQPIKNLMAVATFKTKDGTFVKSDDALIEYNPLLPGQTAPFEVMSSDNPKIEKCRLSFKTIMGGKINHKDTKKQ